MRCHCLTATLYSVIHQYMVYSKFLSLRRQSDFISRKWKKGSTTYTIYSKFSRSTSNAFTRGDCQIRNFTNANTTHPLGQHKNIEPSDTKQCTKNTLHTYTVHTMCGSVSTNEKSIQKTENGKRKTDIQTSNPLT